MEKTLELVFKNEEGAKKTITITYPRQDITRSEADDVMQTIIDKDVFETSGGPLVEAYDARYHVVDIEPLQ